MRCWRGSTRGFAMSDSSAARTTRRRYSYWRLAWMKFRINKLGVAGGVILLLLYFVVVSAEFFSWYPIDERHPDYIVAAPQRVRFRDEGGFSLRPFVYGLQESRHPETRRLTYTEDRAVKYPGPSLGERVRVQGAPACSPAGSICSGSMNRESSSFSARTASGGTCLPASSVAAGSLSRSGCSASRSVSSSERSWA